MQNSKARKPRQLPEPPKTPCHGTPAKECLIANNKETIRVPPSEFNRLVLVDNVAGNVTTSELRQIFGNIGTIEKIYLPVENNQMDGTKRAEILYEKSKHAHTAVKALNHLTLCQQSLKLKLASADSRIDSNFLKASSSTMSKQQETAIDSLLEIH